MPWEGKTMSEYREEFVRRVIAKEKSKSELCREYGISRPTGDKWIHRFQNGDPLSDQSRKPFHTPNKTSGELEEKIVELRRRHPAVGAKKIKRILENNGDCAPAYSTINAILHRNGLITKEASQAATPYIRFEKERPNEMWQADFKGHFVMGDGTRCHPLTVIDDCSRFCLCLEAKRNEKYEGVKESFLSMFKRYGLPDTLLCDNGNPWGNAQTFGYTRFEVWLMELDILTKHCRARHPQTQGKDERYNGTLNAELLRYKEMKDLRDAQTAFDEYISFYNTERPHHALSLDTPAEHYQSSTRKLPQRVEEWEYRREFEARKIKSSGYLTFKGQGYFLSEAFGEKRVGVRESENERGVFHVYYRRFCVAKIDTNNRAVIARRPFADLSLPPQNV